MRRIARAWMALLPLAAAGQGLAQAPAATAIDLPGERVHPESVSIAPNGMAYVSNASGGVFRVALATGKAELWIRPGDFGSGSTFGLLVDPLNGLLWVCSNDLGSFGTTVAGADPGATLKGFDLRSGEGRLSYRLPGERPFCNDIAVAKDGTVYVAETNSSHILRLRPGATGFEDWAADPLLSGPGGVGLDGIAFGGDGQLYVNNYRTNVFARIALNPDGTAGKVTQIATSRPLTVPDGLRPLGGMRFAQAEGAGKIAILTVTGDTAQVETLVEGLSSPTGLDGHRGTLWYVQGELSYIFDPALRARTPPTARLAPVSEPIRH